MIVRLERGPDAVTISSSWYADLPQIDFSRDVLEVCSSSLRLVRVPACGWSDLGTPKRVAQTLRRLEPHQIRPRPVSSPGAPINLAMEHAHLARLQLGSNSANAPGGP